MTFVWSFVIHRLLFWPILSWHPNNVIGLNQATSLWKPCSRTCLFTDLCERMHLIAKRFFCNVLSIKEIGSDSRHFECCTTVEDCYLICTFIQNILTAVRTLITESGIFCLAISSCLKSWILMLSQTLN